MVTEFLEEVFQIPMALGSVSRSEALVSEALAAPYAEAHESAMAAPWANIDETSWREDKHRAWLWVMATALVTVFMVHRHRSTEAAQKLMGVDWAGISITDRFSAYLWIDFLRRQICWAHLDRDFEAMVERGGRSRDAGRALLRESARMFRWWAWVKQGRRSRAWMIRKLTGLQRAVRAALNAGIECGEATTAGVCDQIQRLFPALWTFVAVEGVEPTNNLGEQELRPSVQMRKLSFGTDSATGSRFFERIMTVVMTLRRQKRALLDWLTEAYDAFRLGRPVPSLLPQPP